MSITKLIHKALSDSDIRALLGNDTKILKYSELSRFNSIDELLPQPLDYCVLLYESTLDNGHWVCLSRYNNMYEFFDAYGLVPDHEMEWTNLRMRQKLHEAIPYLTHLLKQEHYIYNTMRYQAMDSYVNTCGSHVVHRLFRLKHDDMDLHRYSQFMKGVRKQTGESYDTIVAEFIEHSWK